MKTIAFFNEKGGVGKSSFSIMFASKLKYCYGIKVGVADFNYRVQAYRDDEIRQKQLLGVYDDYAGKELWPIATCKKTEIQAINDGIARKHGYWLYQQISEGVLKDCDVVILDFPGSVGGNEFKDIVQSQLLGLCIVPVDRDPQTFRATIGTNKALEFYSIPKAGFINQAQSYVTIKTYEEMMQRLGKIGLPVLPDIVSFSERMKRLDRPDIMRSTLAYPNWDDPTFEGSRDLGIENLFIDVARLLNKTPDIKGSKKPTLLPFLKDVQKSFQEPRQLFGTEFPEYEFPKEMFSKKRTQE